METFDLVGKVEIPFDFKFATPQKHLRPLIHDDPADNALVRKSANAAEKLRRKLMDDYIAKENAFMDVMNVSNIDGNVLELPDLPRDVDGNASLPDALKALGSKRLGKTDLLKVLVADALRRKPITGVSPERIAELVQTVQQLKDQQNIAPEAKQAILQEALVDAAEEAMDDDDGEGDRDSDGLRGLNEKVGQILEILNQVMMMAAAGREVKEEQQLASSAPNDEEEPIIVKEEGEEGYEAPAPKAKAEDDGDQETAEEGYKYVFTSDNKWHFTDKYLEKNPGLKPKNNKKPHPFGDNEDERTSKGRRLFSDYTWEYQATRKGKKAGPKKGNGINYYKDPSQLVSRLEVLLGELNAGNDNKTLKNDIFAIADALLKEKAITKATYKAIYQKVGI